MDGVRIGQQHWHANPIILAGYFDPPYNREYAKYGQVDLEPLKLTSPHKMVGRVTNQQLIDSMLIQARDWWCSAIKALRGIRSVEAKKPKEKAKKIKELEGAAWFFVANILHTVQDSWSEAHTDRLSDATYAGLVDHEGHCDDAVVALQPVRQFLSMDFTKYSVHKLMDAKDAHDQWRDCARHTSKKVVELFIPLWNKRLDELGIADIAPSVADLTAHLRTVWALPATVAPGDPAGGSTVAQGTAAVVPDGLITEDELATFISTYVQPRASKFRYAARTAAGILANPGQFHPYFLPTGLDNDFKQCKNIVDYTTEEIEEAQVLHVENQVEEDSESEEELEDDTANPLAVENEEPTDVVYI